MSIWSSVFGSEVITVTEPTTTVDAHGAPKRVYEPKNARQFTHVDVQAGPTGENSSHREGESWDQTAYLDADGARDITKHARVDWRGISYRLHGPVKFVTGAGLLADVAVLNLKRWEG